MAMSCSVSKHICSLLHVEEFIRYTNAMCISQDNASLLVRLPLTLLLEG